MDTSALPYCNSDCLSSDTDQSCVEKQPETVNAPARNSNVIPPSDEDPMPLSFEVDIPNARLPHILEIFIRAPEDFRCVFLDYYEKASEAERHNWQKFLAHSPLVYRQVYPEYDHEDVFDEKPPTGPGQLDLRQPKFLGSGSHSDVFLAPFRPTAAPLRGGVVVKIGKATRGDRDMLKNEAEIYDKFRATLQASSPPIVPKFYGFYAPSSWGSTCHYFDDEDGENTQKVRHDAFYFVHYLGPILLLEFCGEPIRPERLSTIDWNAITGMYKRLHDARFLQNSVYPRNILVQPGPLTHPPAERSLENPSYRLIDFGRGEYYEKDWSKSAKDDLKDEKKRVRRLKYHD